MIYADEAILVADDMVFKSGDYKKAVDHLSSAQGYFDAAGLTPTTHSSQRSPNSMIGALSPKSGSTRSRRG